MLRPGQNMGFGGPVPISVSVDLKDPKFEFLTSDVDTGGIPNE